MQALLFEMRPRAGHEEHYFQRAAALRPLLEQQEGLIFIDRFRSLARPEVILSHSHWRDEASLARWRVDAKHHAAQAAGRNQHFADYRLRIAQVLRYLARGKSTQEWSQAGAYSDPDLQASRFLAIVASEQKPYPDYGDAFKSVNIENAYLAIVDLETEDQGRTLVTSASQETNVTGAMLCLVSRDYGMFERAEAPQYFPAVEPTPVAS